MSSAGSMASRVILLPAVKDLKKESTPLPFCCLVEGSGACSGSSVSWRGCRGPTMLPASPLYRKQEVRKGLITGRGGDSHLQLCQAVLH